MIIADEPYLVPPLADEPNLLRETNISFRTWLDQSFETLKQLPRDDQTDAAKEIAFEGTLCVDGYIAGIVRSDNGKLILGAAGTIDGDVLVREAEINGAIRGDIRATHRLELGSSARVIGDIETAQLLIQSGATFQGRCAFTSEATSAREAA